MKKTLAFVMVFLLFGFNIIAYAADDTPQDVAGVTPDSILYSADKLIEDLQLMFTSDSTKEAELLMQFANERLAEAKVMTQEEKTEFVKTAMEDYSLTLTQAEEKVVEAASNQDTTEVVKQELSEQLGSVTQVDDTIQNQLDSEQQEQLDDTTSQVSYTANVVKNLDTSVVQALREKGMGFGQIAHVVALSELSGKTVDEISTMLKDGKGIGALAKELNVHPSKINNKDITTASEEVTQTEPDAEPTTVSDSNVDNSEEVTPTASPTPLPTNSIVQSTTSKSKAITVKENVKKASNTKTTQNTISDSSTSIPNEDSAAAITTGQNSSLTNKETKNENKSEVKNEPKGNSKKK